MAHAKTGDGKGLADPYDRTELILRVRSGRNRQQFSGEIMCESLLHGGNLQKNTRINKVGDVQALLPCLHIVSPAPEGFDICDYPV